jgi:hypothetical protein
MLNETQIAISRQILNLGGKLDAKLANMFIDEVESLQQQNKQLIDMLTRCLPYVEPNAEHFGYGFFPGGDPTKFTPDEQMNSMQEIENWKEACKRWNEGNGEGEESSHRWLTDGDGKVIGTATVASLGMGSYIDLDEEAKEIVEYIKALQGGSHGTSNNNV